MDAAVSAVVRHDLQRVAIVPAIPESLSVWVTGVPSVVQVPSAVVRTSPHTGAWPRVDRTQDVQDPLGTT